MCKLLVVDDDKCIRKVIREHAELEGYEVTEASHGREAVDLCKDHDYDIIVMGVMMPGLDGFSACKAIKKIKSIPVLILSAHSEEYSKLYGVEIGVVDYVNKPFSPKELMARIDVIIKRYAKKDPDAPTKRMEFGGLEIDTLGRNVYVDGKKIDMTLKEYDLLLYLVKNINIVLTQERILSAVWGDDFFDKERIVDSHIKMLRSNLGNYRDYIVTIRGVGYKFAI